MDSIFLIKDFILLAIVKLMELNDSINFIIQFLFVQSYFYFIAFIIISKVHQLL